MANCESHLLKAAQAIEPSPAQKAGAVRSQNHLRAQLDQGRFRDRITHSYLSGSYARGTAIAPLDDVDIIFLIDVSRWNSPLFSSRPSPDELLKSFSRAVRYRYPESSVRLQRRSVCLQLNHINLDIVPAIALDKDGTTIEIPDRSQDTWIRTSPKTHSEFSSRVNLARGKRLKPVIKLLKFWNTNLPSTARLKSFAIETMATRLFEHEEIDSVQEGLLTYFDFVAFLGGETPIYQWRNKYSISLGSRATLMDASGISNLLENTEIAKLNRFVSQAVRSRDLLLRSQEASRTETAWKRAASSIRFPI